MRFLSFRDLFYSVRRTPGVEGGGAPGLVVSVDGDEEEATTATTATTTPPNPNTTRITDNTNPNTSPNTIVKDSINNSLRLFATGLVADAALAEVHNCTQALDTIPSADPGPAECAKRLNND